MNPEPIPRSEVPSWLVEVPLAHRGLHGEGVVENSRSAFAAAAAAGYGVELDVRLSADGVPVVFHDASLERLAGSSQRVGELTAAELGQLTLLGGDEGIPTLAQVLELLHRTPTMLELKTTRLRAGGLEAAVAGLLVEHPGPVGVASFNPVSLRWFRKHAPTVVRVLTAMMLPRGRGLASLVRHRMSKLKDASSIRPSAISYHLDDLPQPAVDRWQEAGGVVVAWTVTDQAGLERARELADNVIFETVRPVSRR